MLFPTITDATTGIWVTFWNGVWRTYIESLVSGDSAGFPVESYGSGRIVGLDSTVGAPTPTNGLSFSLPENTPFVINGAIKLIPTALIIGGVPANKPNGIWAKLSVVYDSDSQDDIWSATWTDIQPLPGSGVLGKFLTDNDSIISVDRTLEDIIQPEWVKQYRFRLIESLLGSDAPGGGTSGSGTTGGSSLALDALTKKLDEAIKRIDKLEAGTSDGTSTVIIESPNERTRAQLAQLLIALSVEYPKLGNLIDACIVVAGATGIGQLNPDGSSQPMYLVGGNLIIDEVTQEMY